MLNVDEAIRLHPGDANAFASRGFAYVQQKDYERAIADLTEAIRLDPRNVAAYTNRGAAYMAKGESVPARADFDRARTLTRP